MFRVRVAACGDLRASESSSGPGPTAGGVIAIMTADGCNLICASILGDGVVSRRRRGSSGEPVGVGVLIPSMCEQRGTTIRS